MTECRPTFFCFVYRVCYSVLLRKQGSVRSKSTGAFENPERSAASFIRFLVLQVGPTTFASLLSALSPCSMPPDLNSLPPHLVRCLLSCPATQSSNPRSCMLRAKSMKWNLAKKSLDLNMACNCNSHRCVWRSPV